MGQINSYTNLQTEIADLLIRTDLTAAIPGFIQNAESKLRRDTRARTLISQNLTLDVQTVNLPVDFRELESLYHDGPSFFGEIETVSAGELGDVEANEGETGVPSHAAILGQTLRLAPVPDQSYTARLVYWATISRLTANNLSNWLLAEHPDIYLYASLIESAPYLRDDARMPLWKGELSERLEELHRDTVAGQYGGSLVSRPRRHIP